MTTLLELLARHANDARPPASRPSGSVGIMALNDRERADVGPGERAELRVEGSRLAIPERLVMPGPVAGAFVVVGLWQLDGPEIELGAFELPPAWMFGDTSERVTVSWPVRDEPRPSRAGFRLVAINASDKPAQLIASVVVRLVLTPARGTATL